MDKLTSIEREALISLYSCDYLLEKYSDVFGSVCRRIPNGYRDFRMIESRLGKIVQGILYTVPLEQLKTIKRHMDVSEVRIATKKAGKQNDDNWVISIDDLCKLVDYAAKTTCFACDKNGHDCRLRKIMDDLPIDWFNNMVIGCR